jgi:hypothetical protein
MALDADNARVAITGAVSMAPTGSTAPEDATTALDAAFDDLGYVTEDGVSETRDRTTNTIRAWQNADVLREVVTEGDLSFGLTLAETKAETVGLYYGSAVRADGGVPIVPTKTGGRHSFVIDAVDGDQFIRTYIPSGEVLEVGEMVYQNGELIGYEITVKAYASTEILDDDGNPASAIKYYSALVTP